MVNWAASVWLGRESAHAAPRPSWASCAACSNEARFPWRVARASSCSFWSSGAWSRATRSHRPGQLRHSQRNLRTSQILICRFSLSWVFNVVEASCTSSVSIFPATPRSTPLFSLAISHEFPSRGAYNREGWTVSRRAPPRRGWLEAGTVTQCSLSSFSSRRCYQEGKPGSHDGLENLGEVGQEKENTRSHGITWGFPSACISPAGSPGFLDLVLDISPPVGIPIDWRALKFTVQSSKVRRDGGLSLTTAGGGRLL